MTYGKGDILMLRNDINGLYFSFSSTFSVVPHDYYCDFHRSWNTHLF